MAQGEAVVDGEVADEALVQSQAATDESDFRDWKRNFGANFVDVTFFSLGMAFGSLTTIVPLFIRELGGSTLLIGLIPAIVQTGWLLPPLFAARYVARLRRKLPYVLRMTLGERLPWPILAFATLFLAGDNPGLMLALTIILLALFGISGGLTMPAWMDMVATVTPLRMRGKLFGLSGALGGILGVGGGLLAERALERYPFPLNYALCFVGAGICMAISYVALMAIREPPRPVPPAQESAKAFIRSLPILLRTDRDFMGFIVSRILFALGNMAVALIAVYAAEEQGLPSSLAGRFTAWMLATQVVATPLWGELGDRHGHKGSLQFGVLCSTIAMALGLVATTPAWFYVIFALIGASSGIAFTTTMNMVVEFAKKDERVTYLGLHGSLVAPATLIAPLLGGWIAGTAGYRPLFMVAASCSLLALLVLTFVVRDPRHRQIANAPTQGQTTL